MADVCRKILQAGIAVFVSRYWQQVVHCVWTLKQDHSFIAMPRARAVNEAVALAEQAHMLAGDRVLRAGTAGQPLVWRLQVTFQDELLQVEVR